ncbi:hypothetical protein WJX77_008892 [Trebouxia sp. C0004]
MPRTDYTVSKDFAQQRCLAQQAAILQQYAAMQHDHTPSTCPFGVQLATVQAQLKADKMAHEVELRASKVQAERVLEANNSLAENKIRVAANKIRVLEAAIRVLRRSSARYTRNPDGTFMYDKFMFRVPEVVYCPFSSNDPGHNCHSAAGLLPENKGPPSAIKALRAVHRHLMRQTCFNMFMSQWFPEGKEVWLQIGQHGPCIQLQKPGAGEEEDSEATSGSDTEANDSESDVDMVTILDNPTPKRKGDPLEGVRRKKQELTVYMNTLAAQEAHVVHDEPRTLTAFRELYISIMEAILDLDKQGSSLYKMVQEHERTCAELRNFVAPNLIVKKAVQAQLACEQEQLEGCMEEYTDNTVAGRKQSELEYFCNDHFGDDVKLAAIVVKE